jgi:hypothetical protein
MVIFHSYVKLPEDTKWIEMKNGICTQHVATWGPNLGRKDHKSVDLWRGRTKRGYFITENVPSGYVKIAIENDH